jgi:hypothetical protein
VLQIGKRGEDRPASRVIHTVAARDPAGIGWGKYELTQPPSDFSSKRSQPLVSTNLKSSTEIVGAAI